MSSFVPVFIRQKGTTADALASSVAPNKAWWFPTLREAAKARDQRSQDPKQTTCGLMNLIRVTVVEHRTIDENRELGVGVSVLDLPQSVASFIDDILRLKIADGIVLEFDDVHVASTEYRNAIENRLSQVGVTVKFHDVAKRC